LSRLLKNAPTAQSRLRGLCLAKGYAFHGIAVEFLAVPSSSEHLALVRRQLERYEHPLLNFEAELYNSQVQVKIEFRNPPVPVHTYFFYVHPRDAENPQFEWAFQRQLYDCMHDYLVEMFTRTPYNLELPSKDDVFEP
jgi:hypothetical protein